MVFTSSSYSTIIFIQSHILRLQMGSTTFNDMATLKKIVIFNQYVLRVHLTLHLSFHLCFHFRR